MRLTSTLRKAVNRLPYVDRAQGYQAGRERIPFVDAYLPKGGVGAEIGVFKGHFSRLLLHHSQARKLHLIDPWYLLGKEWPWASGSRSTADALSRIIRTNKAELASGQLVLNVGDDMEILATFPDAYFDWVYLDTTHAYEQTKRELALLTKLVKRSGVIAGDDWHSDRKHRHYGVCRAVRELLEGDAYELIYSHDEDHQWAIKASS